MAAARSVGFVDLPSGDAAAIAGPPPPPPAGGRPDADLSTGFHPAGDVIARGGFGAGVGSGAHLNAGPAGVLPGLGHGAPVLVAGRCAGGFGGRGFFLA